MSMIRSVSLRGTTASLTYNDTGGTPRTVDWDVPMDVGGADGMLVKEEATTVGAERHYVMFGSTDMRPLRIASCYGAALGMSVDVQTQMRPAPRSYCVCAYDIECEYSHNSETSERGRILCATLLCSCGFRYTTTCRRINVVSCVHHQTSGDMVVGLIWAIIKHLPLFIVGHNCYAYDNVVMLTHLVNERYSDPCLDMDSLFLDISDHTTYGYTRRCMLTIAGCNNIDTLVWYSSALNNHFTSYALGSLAAAEGFDGKLGGATFVHGMTDGAFLDLIEYNVQDFNILIQLCEKRRVCDNIMCRSGCAIC